METTLDAEAASAQRTASAPGRAVAEPRRRRSGEDGADAGSQVSVVEAPFPSVGEVAAVPLLDMGAMTAEQQFFFAFTNAKAEFPAIERNARVEVKSRTSNTTFEFRYANLDEIFAKTGPALHRHGMVLFHGVRPHPHNDEKAVIWAKLVHVGGHFERAEVVVDGVGRSPQDFGGRLTYMRRYLAAALLGVVAEEDKDGAREDADVKHEAREPQRPAYTGRNAPPPPPRRTPERSAPRAESIRFEGMDGEVRFFRETSPSDPPAIQQWIEAWTATLKRDDLTAEGLADWINNKDKDGRRYVSECYPDVYREAIERARHRFAQINKPRGGAAP